jgi:hypothetical protein
VLSGCAWRPFAVDCSPANCERPAEAPTSTASGNGWRDALRGWVLLSCAAARHNGRRGTGREASKGAGWGRRAIVVAAAVCVGGSPFSPFVSAWGAFKARSAVAGARESLL